MDDITADWNPAEATALTTPSHAAFLVRDGETAWVFAYPQTSMVVSVYPPVPLPEQGEMVGLVRERHVGARASVAEVWATEVARQIERGWTCRTSAAVHVWAGEPWDTMAAFDRPATF